MDKSELAHYKHQAQCEECDDKSVYIHETAEQILEDAKDASALLKMALEDPHFKDDPDRRYVLISAAQGLADAIWFQANIVVDETHGERPSKPQAVQAEVRS